MGCGASKDPVERLANNEVQSILKSNKEEEGLIPRLLFLGTGESGKSTMLKQMTLLYGNGFTNEDRLALLISVKKNLIMSMQELIYQSRILCGDESPQAQSLSHTELASTVDKTRGDHAYTFNTRIAPGLENEQKVILDLDPREPELGPIHGAACKKLWEDPGIRETFRLRSLFQIIDSAPYFFNKADLISAPEYLPNDEDIIMVRAMTSGIVHKLFTVDKQKLMVIDVGGQRTERSKWINCFEKVTALAWVTAVSEFDQTLFEDNRINRMQESFEVFDKIVNHDPFMETPLIIFLNKEDILRQKLQLGIKIADFFPDYKGGLEFESACEFFRGKIISMADNVPPVRSDGSMRSKRSKRPIHIHITNATDANLMKKVLLDVTQIVIGQRLASMGLSV